MNSEEAAKRAYVSPLRAQQAKATRWAVLRAAERLFTENGYVATSISDIAAAAGVGRATVSTVGSKPEILKQAYDTAIAGDDEPTSVAQRPGAQAARRHTDPYALLDDYATHATAISARAAGLAEAIRGAAGADPDARVLWTDIQQQRHRAAQMVVQAVLAIGELREGLEPEAAADLIWLFNDATLYHSLVHVRGWSEEEFRAWRSRTLQTQLLPQP